MANILVVDDELGIRDLLFEILNDEGHHVELAENAAEARAGRDNSHNETEQSSSTATADTIMFLRRTESATWPA